MAELSRSLIPISVIIDTNPVVSRGFFPAIIVPLATNSLNGVEAVAYTSYELAQAANTSGYISAATLAMIEKQFGQARDLQKVYVIRQDVVGGDTLAVALANANALFEDIYAIHVQDRTDAAGLTFAGVVEANSKPQVLIFQSSDADCVTSGLPAAWSAAAAYKRTALVAHPTDAVANAEGWAAAKLAWDPDIFTVDWAGTVAGITDPGWTEAQSDFARANNINVLGTLESTTPWMVDGVCLSGITLTERFTADWFQVRLGENLAAARIRADARGRLIGLDNAGIALVHGVIQKTIDKGYDAGKFVRGTAIIQHTATDTGARSVTFEVQVQTRVGILNMPVTAYLSRTAPVAA